MPQVPDKAAWERLGKLLERRRVTMDPRYSNLSLFAQERGINYRLAWDAEQAQRTNFRSATRLAIDVAYGWITGSVDSVLAGGEPQVAESARGSGRPELVPECEFELRITRSDILTDDLKIRVIRAHRAEEPQHHWCGFTEEQVRAGIASLAASYADRGPPDQAADAEFRWPGGARPAAG